MLVDKNNINFDNPKGFLVLDGVNGAGKTTFQKKIQNYFNEQGFTCLCSREPGATKIGATLREIVVEAKFGRPTPLAEVFLFAADRTQHVSEVIKPALAKKQIVIVDRYYYSTLAFQGYGQGLDLAELKLINEIAIQHVKPDLVLLFDLPVELGLTRTGARKSKENDCFEKEQIDFHERLRLGFKKLAHDLSEPFALIDASLDVEAVWEQVRPYMDKYIQALKT